MKNNQIPFQIRMPKLSLLLSIPVLFVALWLSSSIQMNSKMSDMLPSDSPVTRAQKEFDKAFDAQDQALLVVQSSDVTAAHLYLDTVAAKIAKAGNAHRVLYKVSMTGLEEWLPLYLDTTIYQDLEAALASPSHPIAAFLGKPTPETLLALAQYRDKDVGGDINQKRFEKWMANPEVPTREDWGKWLIVLLTGTTPSNDETEWLVSESNTSWMMALQPKLDKDRYAESAQEFLGSMESILEELESDAQFKGITAGITGGAFVQDVEGDRRAMSNLFSSAGATLVAVILFIIFIFRRLMLPLLMLYPLLLGVVLTTAFATIAYGELNMFSIGFAALLFGLGIDFSVHILSRFLEERALGKELVPALMTAYKKTGSGIFIGAVTTAIAFFSFMLARFKAFSQIGGLSGVGILLMCFVMLFLAPALIAVFHRNAMKPVRNRSWHWLSFVGQSAIRFRVVLTVLLIACGLLLLPAVLRTSLVRDTSQIYPKDLNSLQWLKVVEKEFQYNPNTLIFRITGEEQLRSAVTTLTARDDVQKVSSILEWMPRDEMYKRTILKQMRDLLVRFSPDTPFSGTMAALLINALDIAPFTLSDMPQDLQAMHVGSDGSFQVEVVPKHNIWEPVHFLTLQSAISNIANTTPVGMPAMMFEISALIEKDIPIICLVCLGISLVLLLFMFKRVSIAIITMVPLVLTLYFTPGLMQLLNIPLNLFSILAFPLIIGIGIDGSIHLAHRIMEQPDAIPIAVMHSGKAIITTTITTVLGFGSLILIQHPGMQSLGAATSMGLLTCLFFTLVWIPLLLSFIPNKIKHDQKAA